MGLLERLGLRPPPPPQLRPWVEPDFSGAPSRALPIGPLVTAAATGTEYSLWGGSKLTLQVQTNPIYLQLSRSQPPDPPVWDQPIYVGLGSYGHAGSFGYLRFSDAVAGQHGVVQGTAFAE